MTKSDIYILNSSGGGGKPEDARLDFQHFIFLKLTKDRFLPEHIQASLPENPRIADVGTGTSIWLQELSLQLPNAQLEGFDMTLENYPSLQTLPRNVKLYENSQNVLDPFPSEFLGQYDVVHVRLLLYGLKAPEWDKAFANVTTLLKPGGWLHWEESGYISWVTIPPSRAWYDLLAADIEFAKRSGRDLTHPARLLQSAVKAGLVDCNEHDYCGFELGSEEDENLKEVMARVLSRAAFGVVAKGGVQGLETREDAQKMVEALRRDLSSPERRASLDMKWVWGRKL